MINHIKRDHSIISIDPDSNQKIPKYGENHSYTMWSLMMALSSILVVTSSSCDGNGRSGALAAAVLMSFVTKSGIGVWISTSNPTIMINPSRRLNTNTLLSNLTRTDVIAPRTGLTFSRPLTVSWGASVMKWRMISGSEYSLASSR